MIGVVHEPKRHREGIVYLEMGERRRGFLEEMSRDLKYAFNVAR